MRPAGPAPMTTTSRTRRPCGPGRNDGAHRDRRGARLPPPAQRTRRGDPGCRGATTENIEHLVLPPAGFPCSMEANPKRQENQSHVEHPRALPDVEPIVPELLPPRHVTRRVDLRNP